MLNKKLIQEKIDLISRDLERLNTFSGLTIDEIAKDFIKYAALKNIMMEIIGRAIDINSHLIAELSKENQKTPHEYKEMFLFLGEELKILPKDFSQEIAKSASFRNAIVHGYNNIDKNIIYKSIDMAISQYAKYCQYIKKYLEKN